MKVKFSFALFVCFAILFSGCNKGEVYYRFKHIPQAKWSKDSVSNFTMDSIAVTTGKRYDISIELTNNNQFPYQNLWLFITQNLQDTNFTSDTLQIELADIYGKWHGSGSGGLYQLSIPYKTALPLYPDSTYSIQIRQGMRDEPIRGIEKVGVKVKEAVSSE